MAKFKKGNKMGKGRPKGSKNKTTLVGKERIQQYFTEQGGLDQLLADIEQLEPKDKVNAKIKLIEYFIPKQRENKHNHEIKNSVLEINLTQSNTPPITSENEISDLFDDD